MRLPNGLVVWPLRDRPAFTSRKRFALGNQTIYYVRVPARTSARPTARSAPPQAVRGPDSTDLFIALGAVVKRLRRMPLPESTGLDRMHGAGPAPRHIAALLHIAAHEPIGMTELADRLHVSLATMSQVVTELGDWGLVVRTSDEADRRRTLVSVAREHRPVTSAMVEQRLRPLQRALKRLSPDEAAALVCGLTVLAEELDTTMKESTA